MRPSSLASTRRLLTDTRVSGAYACVGAYLLHGPAYLLAKHRPHVYRTSAYSTARWCSFSPNPQPQPSPKPQPRTPPRACVWPRAKPRG